MLLSNSHLTDTMFIYLHHITTEHVVLRRQFLVCAALSSILLDEFMHDLFGNLNYSDNNWNMGRYLSSYCVRRFPSSTYFLSSTCSLCISAVYICCSLCVVFISFF